MNQDKVKESLKKHDKDTGSSEVQVAALTQRIKDMIEHLKINKKDRSSKRGLLKMVHQRKKLLRYLERTDLPKFQQVVKSLGLRK